MRLLSLNSEASRLYCRAHVGAMDSIMAALGILVPSLPSGIVCEQEHGHIDAPIHVHCYSADPAPYVMYFTFAALCCSYGSFRSKLT